MTGPEQHAHPIALGLILLFIGCLIVALVIGGAWLLAKLAVFVFGG